MLSFTRRGVKTSFQFYFVSKSGKGKKNHTSISSAGNRTPVSRVTGGDTHHYTTEELMLGALIFRHI